MPAPERRRQLLDVGREVFARKGFDGASVEEIAARAGVSKPVVYGHFGGKQGLHADVVDREMNRLVERFTTALVAPGHPRELLERAALVLLDYIEEDTDGFRVLVRGAPVTGGGGPFDSLVTALTRELEHVLGRQLAERGPELAGLHGQALVGMVAMTGQWWLVTRSPGKLEVAAHLAALAYDGLSSLGGGPLPGQGRGRGRGRG